MNEDKTIADNGEGARFLDRDFNQCFQQMRYYENQLWEICKFAFAGYTAAMGSAVGLYQYSVDKQVNLLPAAAVTLGAAMILGVFLLALTVRNRVYYVIVTRYVNEHRRHFLSSGPRGFQNESKMYCNPAQPPYFNWCSSQAWFLYTVSFLNSVLAGLFAFVIAKCAGWTQWPLVIITLCVAILFQLLVSIGYLRSREGKSAARAVFGRE